MEDKLEQEIWTSRKRDYKLCLNDLINFFDSHSESIKQHKLNNMRGAKLIIKELIKNIDEFVVLGQFAEIGLENKED